MNRHLVWVGGAALMVCFAAGIFVSQRGFEIDRAPAPGQQAEAAPITPPPSEEDPAQALEPVAEPGIELLEQGELPSEPQPGTPGVPPPVEFNLDMAYVEGDRMVVRTEAGWKITLTLDVDLQRDMSEMFKGYQVPHAAFVAVEPGTGRVLALVGEESADDPIGNVALKAMAPSASIFKLVTAAALIEGAGVDPSRKTCFPQGEASKPSEEDILGTGGPDVGCSDLGTAFGQSNNQVFSRLAHRHLDKDTLLQWAARFGYNEPVPFQFPVEPSRIDVPEDPIERATTAAGFWNSYLNPLHSALMAAAVANGGVMMRPNLIEEIVNADGEVLYSFRAIPYRRVMSVETARKLAEMMVYTTTVGTASTYMRDPRNLPPEYIPAGKTGTLAQNKPYLMFSWFVGFAPIDKPQVAIGTLLCNPLKWRIKASYASARALKLLYDKQKARQEAAARQAEEEAKIAQEAIEEAQGGTPAAPGDGEAPAAQGDAAAPADGELPPDAQPMPGGAPIIDEEDDGPVVDPRGEDAP